MGLRSPFLCYLLVVGQVPASRGHLNALASGPFPPSSKPTRAGQVPLMLPITPASHSKVTPLSLTLLPSSSTLKGQCDYCGHKWINQNILSILKSITLSQLQSPFSLFECNIHRFKKLGCRNFEGRWVEESVRKEQIIFPTTVLYYLAFY